MGLIQTFLNAFKKGQEDAAAKNRADALEHARSDGLLGPTTESAGGAFNPQRPAPEPESGDRVDPGNLSVAGDAEEAGEQPPPS